MGLFTGVANAISGHQLMKEGNKMYKDALSERDTIMASRQDLLEPESLKKNVALAEEQLGAKSRIQELMEGSADKNYARGLNLVNRYASDSASALNYALGVQDQSNQAQIDAALAGAQDEARRRQEFYGQQDKRTQFALTQYDLNVLSPFLQRLQFNSDRVGAGLNMGLYGRQQKAEGLGAIGDGIASLAITAATGGLGGLAGVAAKAAGGALTKRG